MPRLLPCLVMSCALAWTFANAQPKMPPFPTPGGDAVSEYGNRASLGVYVCTLTQKIDETRTPSPSGETARECVKRELADLKDRYAFMLKRVKKKPALDALKEHYLAAQQAIDGVVPKDDEVRILYTQRQSANDTLLKDKWRRFELEN